jgi:hypothetical protein
MRSKDEIENLLANNLSQWLTKALADEVIKEPELFPLVVDLMLTASHPVNWRAAWVVDHVHRLEPLMLNGYISLFINTLSQVKSYGVLRHIVRILSLAPITLISDGRLVDFCFKQLQSAQTPIAVKAHCMQLVFNLSAEYPELTHELMVFLEVILQTGSKGEISKARKILQSINCISPKTRKKRGLKIVD